VTIRTGHSDATVASPQLFLPGSNLLNSNKNINICYLVRFLIKVEEYLEVSVIIRLEKITPLRCIFRNAEHQGMHHSFAFFLWV